MSTNSPTLNPSTIPSGRPSLSSSPSLNPSTFPSGKPSVSSPPSRNPSNVPSGKPSASSPPSRNPSNVPSRKPSVSSPPSLNPSLKPSGKISLPPSNGPTTSPATQQDILKEVMIDLGFRENQVSSGNKCNWPGVKCHGNGDLKALLLSSFDLSGILATEIGLLRNIEAIDLCKRNMNA